MWWWRRNGQSPNAANYNKKSIRLGTTGSARLSTGNCARNWNLTIRTNGICTTQNLSRKMTRTNFSGILRHKRVSWYRPDLIIINNKKERIRRLVNFAVPTDHRVKLKECKKRDKYQDLARELKKKKTVEHQSDDFTNCNWCSWYKGLVQWLADLKEKGCLETVRTTALLRSNKILRRVLETWKNLLALEL